MPQSFVKMSTTKKDAVKNLLAPKLRFKEFKEEWTTHTLEEVTDTFKSGESITAKDIFDEGEFPVYGGNGLRGYTNTFTHNDFYVLIGRQGALCGNINRVKGKSFISEHAIAVRANNLSDTEWLAQKLDDMKLNRLSESSAQPGLAVGKLLKLKLNFPTLPEQQKIAAFLSAVDEKIQQLTRKKELLTHYKKGVMQQLFSPSELGLEGLEDDRINPSILKSKKSQFRQLRFRQDNDKPYPKWEEKLFEEIYSFFSTNSLSRDKLNYESGSVKNIHYGDIHTKFSSQFIVNEEYVPYVNGDVDLSKVKEENYCKEGDLVIADASEDYNDIGKSIELVELNSEKVIAGLHTFLARPDLSKIKIGFSGYLVQALYVRMQVQKIAQGTKVLSLSSGRLGKVKLLLPCKEEQQKIASFLTALDAKIETVNNQITQTQTFKKGLLQQMFV